MGKRGGWPKTLPEKACLSYWQGDKAANRIQHREEGKGGKGSGKGTALSWLGVNGS